MKRTWWKEGVVYQIYPRSFKDTTGNGLGDIYGIIEKLDYIKSLGVDIIWLCPVYESPNDDNGYDISDYKAISKEFGGSEAFDLLLKGMHQRGLKLVMDLVLNHSSDEHKWFKESRKSKDNPYRDYYFWKSSKDSNPPNNWTSFFSGSAWKKDDITNEYFLHLFTKKQPDLNWENPKVRKEIHDIVDFWCKKGVDGFRMDVISLISKQLEFPDSIYPEDYGKTIKNYYANGPKIHQYLNELNKEVLSKYDIMTVGEGPGIDLSNGLDYVDDSRNELNMIFHFDHMFIDNGPGGKYDPIDVSLPKFKKVFNDWDTKLKDKGWGSIFLGNHDFSRMVSRFGNDSKYHNESAKLLALLLFTLRGTVYVYQGDEIGMTNVAYPSIEDYNDVETLGSWNEAIARGEDMKDYLKLVHRQSRDNARTPMQWDKTKNSGFSEGTPWLKVNPNFEAINVETQENNAHSILNFYRQMIAFRKANTVMVYGDYECMNEDDENLYIYSRSDENDHYIILLNFSDNVQPVKHLELNLNASELIISNLEALHSITELQPWEAQLRKYS
ncbi:glycoside hydrolase family 13 protein [Winogradskyella sp. PG-2]|uniref:glycoside hydrolase family 13 protein n=1 Tax=Winogradskyella sp. PG-2 TaxID=754409 RepID=UPI00045883B5|nr:alpha-glucosidase [Winogradskyella sp. PG-2]BAO76134.1 trehalose-6-phosphate hydrolase [Winogradskyella sp. PG-2]